MIRIGDWLSEAWETFTKSVGVHIVLALIVGLGSSLTIGILAGPLACGWLYVILRQLREPDYEPEIGDIGKGFEVFGQALLGAVLIGVAFAVLWLVLIIISFVIPFVGNLVVAAGMFAVQTAVLFMYPLIIDKRMTAIDAIKQSLEKVKPEFWGFFGFAALISVISGIGGAICGAGWLVAGPVTMIAVAIAYRDNFGEASALQPEMPEMPAPPQPPVAPPPVEPPAAE